MKLLVQTALFFSTLTFGILLILTAIATIDFRSEPNLESDDASDDVSVLLNAEKGDTSEETIFLLAEDEDGDSNAQLMLCGGVHLGRGKALTAAHCVDKAEKLYLGKGTLDITKRSEITETDDFFVKRSWAGFDPFWTFGAVKNDLAIIEFNESFLDDKDKAVVSSFEKGCNYYITAYGGELGEYGNLSIDEPRKQQVNEVCIEEFDDEVILLQPRANEGFCQGDSGSPVYEIGTNKVVGVISSTIGETEKDLCDVNNRALAVRLDANWEFLEDEIRDLDFDEDELISSAKTNSVDDLADYISSVDPEEWEVPEVNVVTDKDVKGSIFDSEEQDYTEIGLIATFVVSGLNFILSFIGFIASFSLSNKNKSIPTQTS